jgi:molybdopterin-binding protein
MTQKISGRNQLPGRIIEIRYGDILVEVSAQVGEQIMDAVITRRSAENLQLKIGDPVVMLIKATEVMVIKELPDS